VTQHSYLHTPHTRHTAESPQITITGQTPDIARTGQTPGIRHATWTDEAASTVCHVETVYAAQTSSTRARHKQRGQGMTEYVIVVALVAIAAIAVFQLFGQVIRSQTAAMAKELAGEDGSEQSRAAQAAAESAAAQTASKTLKSFTGNAGGQ